MLYLNFKLNQNNRSDFANIENIFQAGEVKTTSFPAACTRPVTALSVTTRPSVATRCFDIEKSLRLSVDGTSKRATTIRLGRACTSTTFRATASDSSSTNLSTRRRSCSSRTSLSKSDLKFIFAVRTIESCWNSLPLWTLSRPNLFIYCNGHIMHRQSFSNARYWNLTAFHVLVSLLVWTFSCNITIITKNTWPK